MKTKTLHQSVLFQASSHEIYEALLDSKKHSEFTGAVAQIGRGVGAQFSVFDDWASGENVELVPDRKIVQSWRVNDWPKDHMSEIRIVLQEVLHGTRMDFTQTGIPFEKFNDIARGWTELYWEKLKVYFDRR